MEGNTTPKGSVSFRDSDVEFLQTQAREWLEAMLGEKLEQEGSLAEILANGAILYRVSQFMKELIRTKLGNNVDIHSPSKMLASPDVVSKGKNSQKYLPYSYVEAFLKVSKDMVGLLDVDLFNPSDAVEMKDIRRVCVCLRRLSKKARAQQLPVPDFDNVAQTMTTPIHKLAMPTEFVHGLKESLQKSASKSYTPDLSKETSSRIADLRKPEVQVESSDYGIGNGNGFNEPGKEIAGSRLLRNEGNTGEEAGVLPDRVPDELYEQSGNRKPSIPSLPALLYTEQEQTAKGKPQDRDYSIANPSAPGNKPSKLSIFHREEKRTGEAESRHVPPSYTTNEKAEQQGFGTASVTNTSKPPRTTSTPLSDATRKTPNRETMYTSEAEKKSGQEIAKGKKAEKRKTSLPWFPVLAGVVVFVGTYLALTLRSQSPPDYEVKKGDTLSMISRRSGKSNWQELVHNNPHISNPDLIYPSERLKL